MAGTGWQSSDCLARFNTYAARPTSDTVSDATKYQYLADAQDEVITDVANIGGSWLFGAPTLMTSADGGFTYTYGTDGNGYALFPLAARIYPSLSAVPDYPWTPGRDYVDEGVQIRSLYNTPFPVAPYYQGINPPAAITASVQPVIQPPQARILIVWKAVQNFATSGKRDTDLMTLAGAKYQTEWAKQSLAIRKHLRGRGSVGPLVGYMGVAVQGFPSGGW